MDNHPFIKFLRGRILSGLNGGVRIMVEEGGRLIEGQKGAMCPTHPQSKQIADIPSY